MSSVNFVIYGLTEILSSLNEICKKNLKNEKIGTCIGGFTQLITFIFFIYFLCWVAISLPGTCELGT